MQSCLISLIHLIESSYPFHVQVAQPHMLYQSVFEDSQLRDMPVRHHGHLQSVKIGGFSSAKCLVELACYILKNAVSLECLTLNTIYGRRCGEGKCKSCPHLASALFKEAHRAVSVIRTYIENKVPSTVSLTVLGPCFQCYASGRMCIY